MAQDNRHKIIGTVFLFSKGVGVMDILITDFISGIDFGEVQEEVSIQRAGLGLSF